GVGHNGHLLIGGGLHIIYNFVGRPSARRVIFVPLLFGQILHKRVKPFVHPCPLALVTIYNHGEIVVAHFVNNHRNHSILGGGAIGSVSFGTSAIKANHGVFHPNTVAVHRNGFGVWVVKSVLAV